MSVSNNLSTRFPRQCAILVGGLGSRLGSLTSETPKPLLDCGGRPYLAWILRELQRYGIQEFVLLAGFRSTAVDEFAKSVHQYLPKKCSVKVSVEKEPMGTGGALAQAKDMLDDRFMLINGDSWFDVNLVHFLQQNQSSDDTLAHILLNQVEDASRFGVVELDNGSVREFYERPPTPDMNLVNAGMYILSKDICNYIDGSCSLERDIYPKLAKQGLITGEAHTGYFIDIGIPDDYKRGCVDLPKRFLRGAVFFDRDGVLNTDLDWVGTVDRFHWKNGAKQLVKHVNDIGLYSFVVTNQAGVARGFYSEHNVLSLYDYMQAQANSEGAHFDDWRYCPYHPTAPLAHYRKESINRKPKPGMLNELIDAWELNREKCLMIGDSETDMQAASAAGITGRLVCKEDDLIKCLHDINLVNPTE